MSEDAADARHGAYTPPQNVSHVLREQVPGSPDPTSGPDAVGVEAPYDHRS